MKTLGHALLIISGLLIESSIVGQCTAIIDQDFNHWNDHQYTVADAKSDFNNQVKPWTASTYRGLSGPGTAANLIGDVKQETWVIDGALRAEYTKDDAGGYAGGFLFDPYFDGVDQAYLEYKVKFDKDFFWATGGKLPGLGGSTSGIDSETTGRGTIPSGCKYNTNGWSARLMWRRNREQTNQPYLILYSYFAERENGEMRQDGDCGDGKRIYTGLKDDTWYTIRQYIKMNTPGQKDGTVVMWIDGEETYRDEQAMIRNSGKGNLNINALIMNTYRGGSRTDPVWHSPRDEYAFFDDFKVWTGCSESPSTHVNSAPTGSFLSPTIADIDEGYDQLYVHVDANDADEDDISVTLKIDGTTTRTEQKAPFEWGHDTSPDSSETLHLSPGEHLFEAIITDSHGASTTVSKTIVVNDLVFPPEIAITYPTDGAIFILGQQVEIAATATDQDGQIDRVNFKLDGGYHSQDPNGEGNAYNSVYQFDAPGTYTLGARAFDDQGASTEVSITIEVTAVTGWPDQPNRKYLLFPNPTANHVFLKHPTKWELYSTSGRLIEQGNGTEINLENQPAGRYLVGTQKGVFWVVRK